MCVDICSHLSIHSLDFMKLYRSNAAYWCTKERTGTCPAGGSFDADFVEKRSPSDIFRRYVVAFRGLSVFQCESWMFKKGSSECHFCGVL